MEVCLCCSTGFEQQSVITSLGRMVYYTAAGAPWRGEDTAGSDLETLVFCTVLAVGRHLGGRRFIRPLQLNIAS